MTGKKSAPEQSGEPAAGAEDEYKIGPGHPPVEHQFKKGGPSPNPKGRPRKDATILPDVRKFLQDGLNKKVKVTRGEKQAFLTRAELGIEQLLNRFAKGERHAQRDLMDMAEKFGVDLLAGQRGKIEQALLPSHQAILDDYVSRQPRPEPVPPWQVTKVIASPALLDGIVTIPPKTTRPVIRTRPPEK
jgi:Family of unknown function (DUF5681)